MPIALRYLTVGLVSLVVIELQSNEQRKTVDLDLYGENTRRSPASDCSFASL